MDHEQNMVSEAPHVTDPIILFLLRRLERMEMIIDHLSDKKIIGETDLMQINLQAMLRHGERVLKAQLRVGEVDPELQEAVSEIRKRIA